MITTSSMCLHKLTFLLKLNKAKNTSQLTSHISSAPEPQVAGGYHTDETEHFRHYRKFYGTEPLDSVDFMTRM